MSTTPTVSVVIPFYNRRGQVSACLDSVLAQELPGGATFEVIAVDNNSTDGTAEELARYPVRVAHCRVPGPAAARNAGIAVARGDIVAMTDSDCVAEAGWLAALLEPFSDPEMLATGGRVESLTVTHGVELFSERNLILNQRKFLKGVLGFPPFFATCNVAYRRAALEKAGGFDEALRVAEDSDMTWRVMDQGGRIAYCHGAFVRHAHRTTFSGLFWQGVDYGVGAAHVFAKHRHRFGRVVSVQWHDIAGLAAAPLNALRWAVFGTTPWERRLGLYDAVYRTGFTLGRLRGSLRHRVVFL